MEEKLRIIVSGGGTGGHIFPAVSIANAIKELYPDTQISVSYSDLTLQTNRLVYLSVVGVS